MTGGAKAGLARLAGVEEGGVPGADTIYTVTSAPPWGGAGAAEGSAAATDVRGGNRKDDGPGAVMHG